MIDVVTKPKQTDLVALRDAARARHRTRLRHPIRSASSNPATRAARRPYRREPAPDEASSLTSLILDARTARCIFVGTGGGLRNAAVGSRRGHAAVTGGASPRDNRAACSSRRCGVTFTATLLSSNVYARVCTGTHPSARTTTSSGPESRGRWTISGACGRDRAELLLPPEHHRLLRRRQDREHDAHVAGSASWRPPAAPSPALPGARQRRRPRQQPRAASRARPRHECGQSRARHSPPPPPPAFASAESGAAGTGSPGGYLPHGVGDVTGDRLLRIALDLALQNVDRQRRIQHVVVAARRQPDLEDATSLDRNCRAKFIGLSPTTVMLRCCRMNEYIRIAMWFGSRWQPCEKPFAL